MKKMFVCLLIAVAMVSCIEDEFNTDRLSDEISVSPGVALTLAKTSLTMGDILSDETDQVKYYQDEAGNERIMFFQHNDSVEYVGLDELFKIDAISADVPVPYVAFNTESEIAVDLTVPFTVPQASVTKVELSYTLFIEGNNLETPLLVTVSFPTANVGEGGKVLSFEVYNNQRSEQVSTNDLFEITNNELPLSISVQPLNGGSTFGNTIGNLSIGMENMSISYVKGSMAENSLNLDEGLFDLDFDVLEDVPGDVEFANPQLTVLINNATPFDGIIYADLKGELENESFINLNAPPIDMPACPADQDYIDYRYNLNKDNSNLTELVDLKPSSLIYAGQMVLNPDATNTDEIELYADDRIYIGYGIEIPLDLRLDGSIDIDAIDLGELDVIEDLTKATLVFTSDNGFPFSANAKLEFYDEETDAILETIDVDIVKGAVVDATTGIVIDRVSNTENVVLSDSQIEKLIQSEELRVSINLKTTDYDDGQSVVLLKENGLDLQLSIKGKIETN